MKVALVHDYLNQFGGAERVLESLLTMFPDADLYTLLYSKDQMRGRFGKHIRNTSFLDYEFVGRHHRLFIPFMPLAAQLLRFKEKYDLVISDSAGYAKGVRVPEGAFHLSYCHTPLRYAWETKEYFTNKLFTTVFYPAFQYVKYWDYFASKRPHQLLANSSFIAQKIKNYYGLEVPVVYPPIREELFFYDPKTKSSSSYYLAIGRLLHYKRFDLVIHAFHKLGLPLLIVGNGPKETMLKKMIKDLGATNITMKPFVTNDREVRTLYANAKAVIFPQVEDFGLVAAEAQACGTPVVAQNAGGAAEIVLDGVTGVLFNEENPSALEEAVRRAEAIRFNREHIAHIAKRFSFQEFQKGILAHIPSHLRGKIEI